ncbi:hypothetical protein [Nocardioides sp.]|uniref:hypothetical protein n=1 Tax=Nocardioides sp. TaxID=35761 RepID=UPI002B26BCD2|nr:hypothetical protein [Nocardioides sp.]
MDNELVFITQLIIAFFVSLIFAIGRSPDRVAHFVALSLARTGVMAAGAVLVVVTVSVVSSSGPGFEGESGGAFASALLLAAFCLATERHVVLIDPARTTAS